MLKITAIGKSSLSFWYQNKDIYFPSQKRLIDLLIIVAADVACIPVWFMIVISSAAFYIATGLA